MTCQDNDKLVNLVLIQMARSFLQYVAESSPWVSTDAASLESQVQVLSARQRQNVGLLAELLNGREYFIDFGSFPTEYTDQQFLSLSAVLTGLKAGQKLIVDRVAAAVISLRAAGDSEAAAVLERVEAHEADILKSLDEVRQDLTRSAAART